MVLLCMGKVGGIGGPRCGVDVGAGVKCGAGLRGRLDCGAQPRAGDDHTERVKAVAKDHDTTDGEVACGKRAWWCYAAIDVSQHWQSRSNRFHSAQIFHGTRFWRSSTVKYYFEGGGASRIKIFCTVDGYQFRPPAGT